MAAETLGTESFDRVAFSLPLTACSIRNIVITSLVHGVYNIYIYTYIHPCQCPLTNISDQPHRSLLVYTNTGVRCRRQRHLKSHSVMGTRSVYTIIL